MHLVNLYDMFIALVASAAGLVILTEERTTAAILGALFSCESLRILLAH